MEKEGKRNLILIIALIVLILVVIGIFIYSPEIEEPLLSPGDTITRSFDINGPYVNEVVTVTLSVDVQGTIERGVTIEEHVPSGVSITEISNGGTYNPADNKIRWAIEGSGAQPISDMDVTYKINFLSTGTYNEFGQGIYIFISEAGDVGSERAIEGTTTVTVASCTPSPESCDGLDNDCDRVIDNGGDALCSGNTPTCGGTSGCGCNSNLVNDVAGNCNNICDLDESQYPLDQAGNCNGICEETRYVLDHPGTVENGGGDCNDCVGIGEIGRYKDNYLVGDRGISAADYTVQRRDWLEGITACN